MQSLFSRINTRPSLGLMQRLYSTGGEKPKNIPKNVLEGSQTAHLQAENGVVFDKKPFKIHLDQDKVYSWCLCGKSKLQPICDGTHKDEFLKIKLRPIRFKVEKTGDYWLCNCKHTKHRPFCDGTHKQKHIQEAVK
ncbi:CDGSH iron-sulfur domain-containing protein 3, mitochondrial [Stomoxys calcitrans]|uniref:Iron-binding zinc finger CDGSH type domain-containing protein n=1 Tax=Stomoxys calcitrans TaxID=35570 RepID=A0A1I8PB00_STOCA|nr:CDGSH iron-sulfur domain-containing protein 3, mitochondrial [Stomoxys calcitrans]